MEGFLSKCIGLVLILLMLIIAPLINIYSTHEAEDRMELLNSVSVFLDKVTDKGSITEFDLNEFYLEVESHGMILNVEVNRLVKTSNLLPDGSLSTTYIVADEISWLNVRDIVQVKLEEVSSTPFKKIAKSFLGIEENQYELSMAKMVK